MELVLVYLNCKNTPGGGIKGHFCEWQKTVIQKALSEANKKKEKSKRQFAQDDLLRSPVAVDSILNSWKDNWSHKKEMRSWPESPDDVQKSLAFAAELRDFRRQQGHLDTLAEHRNLYIHTGKPFGRDEIDKALQYDGLMGGTFPSPWYSSLVRRFLSDPCVWRGSQAPQGGEWQKKPWTEALASEIRGKLHEYGWLEAMR